VGVDFLARYVVKSNWMKRNCVRRDADACVTQRQI
jgi:hypothetical protein